MGETMRIEYLMDESEPQHRKFRDKKQGDYIEGAVVVSDPDGPDPTDDISAAKKIWWFKGKIKKVEVVRGRLEEPDRVRVDVLVEREHTITNEETSSLRTKIKKWWRLGWKKWIQFLLTSGQNVFFSLRDPLLIYLKENWPAIIIGLVIGVIGTVIGGLIVASVVK